MGQGNLFLFAIFALVVCERLRKMLDQFYTITKIESQTNTACIEVALNPAHAVYNGHFPGMPVVPGVCTLMMVKSCFERWKGKRFVFRLLNSCKFLTAIRPEQNRLLTIKLEEQERPDGLWGMSAQIYAGDQLVFKLKANLSLR